jgi:2-polyprenyl-3-methyl-5-hydroxy-6-metoxy-1,4-benzoquinol methylase
MFLHPKKRFKRNHFTKKGNMISFMMDGRTIKVKLGEKHVEYENYEDWRRLQELKGDPEWLERIWENLREKHLSFYDFAELKPDQRVLDVGFRDGYNLKYLKETGMNITGIEVNRYAIEHAKQMGLNVFYDDIQTRTQFTDNSFDVILLCDVFEHLFAPDAALDECIRLLNTHGKIVLEVPLETEFSENVLHGHAFLFYSEEYFEKMLNSHALKVEKTSWYDAKYRVVARRAVP